MFVVCKTLGQYIVDLDKWIEKTKLDIDAAQNSVQNISNEVNGIAKSQNLPKLESAIHKVETELDGRAKDLQKWKAAAEKVLQGTIEKGYDVHKNMDPTQQKDPPGKMTKIGKGLQQITTAKGKVLQVNTRLQDVHKDLEAWNSAAKGVLSNVVQKAQNVHTRLEPTGSQTLATNIKIIGDAKTQLDTANGQLDKQVQSLNSWISTAEGIRQAAEDKAKEAYDKLKVNETLDKNVKLIVTANKKINEVNKSVTGHLGSLGAWNKQASVVLGGAIDKANEVYEKLDPSATGDPIGQKIEGISSSSDLIKKANTELAKEIDHLGKWSKAARNVIDKAEQKCDDILKKVSQKDADGVIFTQAQSLQDAGKKLLDAATEAKNKVGQYVTEALDAVVKMDTSLKKDLRTVKEKIKGGIENVIEKLQVTKLDGLVKSDLQSLKDKISGLTSRSSESKKDNGQIISMHLQTLEDAKNTFNENGVQPINAKLGEMDNLFKTHIQHPLERDVLAVDTAIGTLGGNFQLIDPNNQKLEEIFKKIKEQVGEIKGTVGTKKSSWEIENATGLTGIAQGVDHYFNFFKGDFDKAVGGWVDGILGQNGLVKRLLGWQDKPAEGMKSTLENTNLGGFIRSPINLKADAAGAALKGVNDNAGMADKITQVKQACENFADALDAELKKEPGSGVLEMAKQAKNASKDGQYENKRTSLGRALEKANCGCGDCNASRNPDKCTTCDKKECNLTQAIATTLVAVSSVSRQVSKELHSVLLGEGTGGINIAQLLDNAKKVTVDLDKQLNEATAKPNPPGGSTDSPAKAVDSRLTEVRNEVGEKLNQTFKTQVKDPLQQVVNGLPSAVSAFDSEAQKQIKAAAMTAITKAAEQIEMDKSTHQISVKDTMETFYKVHEKIIDKDSGLQKQLNDKVDEHIGKDENACVNIKDTQQFTHYKDHVKQDSEGLKPGKSLKGEPTEGKLPEAIGKFRDQVNNEMNMIGQDDKGLKNHIAAKYTKLLHHEYTKTHEEVARKVHSAVGKQIGLPKEKMDAHKIESEVHGKHGWIAYDKTV
ncbi:Extracellular matrix-binding ebh, putative [Babesia ovata]|uniref:Extracellular matrix-binding ebh, putative n=1 Tax=Babesia ovata TaxID=189622 RepID=A0A2H6KDI9_9APIC|nr:Extracellular matrix-binding ebh, putative [Babesia ovata]GBE61044.1 Extracellular matrix-binding ebh, putative [Babesia ovata]